MKFVKAKIVEKLTILHMMTNYHAKQNKRERRFFGAD